MAEKLLSPSLLCVRGTSSLRMSLELDRNGRRPTSDRRRVVGVVRAHSRSWAMSPFDRAHTTSYSTLIETMCLSFTVSDIASYLSKVTDFDPLHLHLVPPRRCLASENYSPWPIVWCFLCDPTFSRFSGTPTCGRQTQGHS